MEEIFNNIDTGVEFYSRMELLETDNGEILYKSLENLFPGFYELSILQISVTSEPVAGSFIPCLPIYKIKCATGYESFEMYFTRYDLPNNKMQFTFSLEDCGYYIEASYNDVNNIVSPWVRNNKLINIGIK
jgi:hypothetical protein